MNSYFSSGISFFGSIFSLKPQFWLLNILQMLEKLAYWSVLLQMSVYTAQKDIEGGLNWEQSLKGIIFFVWAVVQNLTPFFLGVLPDRYGRKKFLVISLILIVISYILLGTQKDFTPFLIGVLLLGFASGLFKPALQGALASTLSKGNEAVGWGVYFMLLNLAVFAAPGLSKFLKEISWDWVFFGSAAIMALNFIFIFALKNKDVITEKGFDILNSIKVSMKHFIKPEVYLFVVFMSGFAILYMQFYETFQNFILDWSDTSNAAETLSLPTFMLSKTTRGIMISYEWLYAVNSILITLFVVLLSWLTGFIHRIKAIIIGVILAIAGVALAGTSMQGGILIAGFIVYTFGEMITNPKFTDHLSSLSDKANKSMYLGYLNLSMALGLGGGALLGGYLYQIFAEKSGLAVRYMTEHGIDLVSVNHNNAFSYLSEKLNMSHSAVTDLLWNSYNPWIVWLPFLVFGGLSVIGLVVYYQKYGQKKSRI